MSDEIQFDACPFCSASSPTVVQDRGRTALVCEDCRTCRLINEDTGDVWEGAGDRKSLTIEELILLDYYLRQLFETTLKNIREMIPVGGRGADDE